MVYEDSRQQAGAGMHQLPDAMQSSLLVAVVSKQVGALDKTGSSMYLLLIQICGSMPSRQNQRV